MRSRLERAEDKRDDLTFERNKWGWSWPPSRHRQVERRIARLDLKIRRLKRL